MSEPGRDIGKVLLFAASFPPPFAGGSVEYLYHIFSHFPEQTVVVHTADADPGTASGLAQTLKQRVIRSRYIIHVVIGHKVTRLRSLVQNLLWPPAACILALRERPRVVAVGEFGVVTLAALALKALAGIPYVLFTYAEEITFLDTRPWYRRLLTHVLRHAAAVFTVSEYTQRLLLERGAAPERIHKVLPSVGRSKCRPTTPEELERVREKYGLCGKKILLTVGRIVERKGHRAVIRALPQVLARVPEAAYVVAGIGPDEAAVKETAREVGVADRVVFAGCVEDSELTALYALCDVFVMPHREIPGTNDTEGCPTVFLEASAHGKPCIGGNAGGVSDAILAGKTGLIIEGNSTEQVAAAINYLLNNPEEARMMGQRGQEYVVHLTPEANSRKVQEVLAAITTSAH